MDEGQVLYANSGDVHMLRFLGDARYPLVPALNRLLDDIFAQPHAKGVLVDLTQADLIDSTCLGSLARIANELAHKGHPKAMILVDSDDIETILMGVGFDEVFDILQQRGGTTSSDIQFVSLAPSDDDELDRTVLEAHRTLMELNERNAEAFRDVTELLEKECNAKQ